MPASVHRYRAPALAFTLTFLAMSLVMLLAPSIAHAESAPAPVQANPFVAFVAGTILPLISPELVAVLVALGLPVVLAVIFKPLAREQQDQLLKVTQGIYSVVALIARSTPMTLDDQIAAIIKQVADEMGRELKPAEAVRVKNIALAMHADPNELDLKATPSEVQRAFVSAPPKP
jgi:hypothetical protein